MARQMIGLADGGDDPGQLVAAHGAMADNLLCVGDPVEASRHAAQAIAHYDPGQHEALASLFGYDPGVAAYSLGALALWQAGHPEQAIRSAEAASALASSLAHPPTQAFGAAFSSWTDHLTGSLDVARRKADECIAISTQFDLPAFLAFGQVFRGWVLIAQGEAEPGAALARAAVDAMQASGFIWGRSFCLGVVAQGLADAGRTDEALATLDEAFGHASRTGERFHEAELLRLKGEILLRSEPRTGPREAERSFLQAIEIAERQKARSCELRATTSLARQWRDEGGDTADLTSAKALLQTLERL